MDRDGVSDRSRQPIYRCFGRGKRSAIGQREEVVREPGRVIEADPLGLPIYRRESYSPVQDSSSEDEWYAIHGRASPLAELPDEQRNDSEKDTGLQDDGNIEAGRICDGRVQVISNDVSPEPPTPKKQLFALEEIAKLRVTQITEGGLIVDHMNEFLDAQNFREKTLFLINVCAYGMTTKGEFFVPGELSIVAFNMNELLGIFHTFVDPRDFVEIFDNYPLMINTLNHGLRPRGFDPGYQNLENTVEQMEDFIEKFKVGNQYPPFLCLKEDWDRTAGSLNWLYTNRFRDIQTTHPIIPVPERPYSEGPRMWLAPVFLTKLSRKLKIELMEKNKLVVPIHGSQLGYHVDINDRLHLRPDDLISVIPAGSSVEAEKNKCKNLFFGKGTAGKMLKRTRELIGEEHAEEFLGLNHDRQGIAAYRCDFHQKDLSYGTFCTTSVASSMAFDFIEVVKYITLVEDPPTTVGGAAQGDDGEEAGSSGSE